MALLQGSPETEDEAARAHVGALWVAEGIQELRNLRKIVLKALSTE